MVKINYILLPLYQKDVKKSVLINKNIIEKIK